MSMEVALEENICSTNLADDHLAGIIRNFNFRLQDIQPGMYYTQW